MGKNDVALPAEEKTILHLLDGTKRTAMFSILVGLLLVIYLFFSEVPLVKLSVWYSLTIVVNILRIYICNIFITKKFYINNHRTTLLVYTLLSTVVAMLWGSTYFIFQPDISSEIEIIILLVLGGMAAGAMGTLASFLPAYFLFVFFLFTPVIADKLMTPNLTNYFFVTVIFIYAIILFMQANIIRNVLFKTYVLTFEKDTLIQQLSQYVEKLKHLSITDPLTGLYNRRFFDKMLKLELNRAYRNKYSLSLLIIDVDKFKFINDHYGHPFGDKFLIHLARMMMNIFKRSNDTVFRIGGDEFAIILINQSMESIESISKKLCEQLKRQQLPENSPSVDPAILFDVVDLSIGGVHLTSANNCKPENLFLQADKLLYQVKMNKEEQLILKSIDEL